VIVVGESAAAVELQRGAKYPLMDAVARFGGVGKFLTQFLREPPKQGGDVGTAA